MLSLDLATGELSVALEERGLMVKRLSRDSLLSRRYLLVGRRLVWVEIVNNTPHYAIGCGGGAYTVHSKTHFGKSWQESAPIEKLATYPCFDEVAAHLLRDNPGAKAPDKDVWYYAQSVIRQMHRHPDYRGLNAVANMEFVTLECEWYSFRSRLPRMSREQYDRVQAATPNADPAMRVVNRGVLFVRVLSPAIHSPKHVTPEFAAVIRVLRNIS